MSFLSRKKLWRRVSQRNGRSASTAYIEEMKKIKNGHMITDMPLGGASGNSFTTSSDSNKNNNNELLSNYYIQHLYCTRLNSMIRKKVTFDSSLRVVLIPTRHEYIEVGLVDELWWTSADYSKFRHSKLHEEEKDKVAIQVEEISLGNHNEPQEINEIINNVKSNIKATNSEKIRDLIDITRERNQIVAEEARQRKKQSTMILRKQIKTLTEVHDGTGKRPNKSWNNYQIKDGIILAKDLEADPLLVSVLPEISTAFFITNPRLPDNPIILASQSLLDLTLYRLEEVIGKNCRFLQGPGTDKRQVESLRKGIHCGIDTTVVLLNYRADGTPFYNQVFLAPLRDKDDLNVKFCVGTMVEVELEEEIRVSIASKTLQCSSDGDTEKGKKIRHTNLEQRSFGCVSSKVVFVDKKLSADQAVLIH